MWASRYFNPRYWAERFWAKVGAASVQTQEVVRLTDMAVTASRLASESVSWSHLDTQDATAAWMASEVVG